MCMKKSLLLSFCLALVCTGKIYSQVIYNYTGAVQTYTVPAGVTSINVLMWGAGGAGADRGGAGNAGAGGSGAFVKGTLAVTPGQVLQVVVGGRGTYSTTNGTHAGGYGGGGTAYQNAGSGGGYSGIFLTTVSFANARAIAGGGGGAGYGRARNFGGGGGATTGTTGGGLDATHTGGTGGTIAAAGTGGAGTGTTTGAVGAQLLGGTGGNAGAGTYGGAGGGGGYYGGGGGYSSNTGGGGGTWGSGGGGGASYTSLLTTVTNTAGTTNTTGGANNPPGTGEANYNGTAGIGGRGDGSNGSDGLVVINATPDCSGTPVITSVSISATTGAPNSAITLSAVIPNVAGLTYQWQSGTTAGGPWTSIAGATSNPSTVFAPATLSTATYYRLVLTCSNSGLSTNSSTTLLFTTNAACSPSSASNATYIDGVSTTGYVTNINKPATGFVVPGYTNYYATANAQVTVPAGTTLNLTAAIVRGTGGGAVYESFYADWNNDGIFDLNTEFLDYYTTTTNGTYAFAVNIPSNAPLGDHRLRMIADRNALSLDPCVITSNRGEAEDYKITIIANSCNTAPTTTPNTTYSYITQVAFVGTPVIPPVNNSGSGLVSGYSNYTGLAAMAQQEQGEGVNVSVSVGGTYPRAKFGVWVDWNNDGIFSSPSECIYYLNDVHTNNTTFGFQIPTGTTPGNYKIRIRSFNYLDDLAAPNSIITPCGVLYNGETEDYLFKVLPRCNARIASVAGQAQCSSGAIAFTLGATGVDASTTGFNWYTLSSGGTVQPGSVFNGGAPPTGSFTTPAISTTTPYYVSATGLNTLGAACESPRVAVVATHNANITITFNPAGPLYVCQGAGLSVQGGTSTEIKTLINEDFESGGLGLFSVVNTTATPAASVANMQWRNRTSVYVPAYTSVWQPAISSGFGSNKFALAVSDVPSASLNTSLQLTNAVSTIGFTSLTLDYDIFYDSYLGNGTDGSNPVTGYDTIVVEVSTNNTTYTAVQTFILDQGTGTQFIHQSVSLLAYLNQSNLKVRFRYRANWVDGVAVDNIKLSGTTATSSNYTWLPTGPGADINSMFLDAAYTQPYIAGTNVSGIYVNPTAAQIIAGTDLSFQSSLTLSNGCLATGTIVIKLNDKVWEGDEDANWHNPGNWCGDLVPLISTSVLVPAGTPNMPVISSGAAYARKIEIAPGASLTINNPGTGSLSVSTDFINNGTLTNNGTIILSGTTATAQNFPGPGTISAMNTLEINNTGAGVLLNNNLRIGTKLAPTSGNLSLNNSDITIGSDALHTAYVSPVGVSAGFTYGGSGRFVIERFLPARRAWRLMTAPIASGGQTINEAWQEGAGGTWSSNPSPGYGTHITGGPTRNTAQGYDQGPFNPSICGHTATGWNYLPATTSEAITSQQGWLLFVRGSRAINLPTSTPSTVPDNTILRPRGVIKLGTQPAVSSPSAGFMVVGNPYPAPLNFKNITKSGLIGGMGGNNAYYLWDPTLNGSAGVGAYVTLSWNSGTGRYDRSIVTGGGTSQVSDEGVIPSSTAFLVNANAGASVTIEENDKDTVVYGNSYLFRPAAAPSSLRASLYEIEPDGSKEISDGNLITFSGSSSNNVDNEDAVKPGNAWENFAVIKNNRNISIERRNLLAANDTIFYSMWNMRQKTYTLEIATANLDMPAGSTAFLEDNYLHKKTALDYSGTTSISFTVSADTASASKDRFRIIIRSATVLPVTFTTIKAYQLNHEVKVEWSVENETGIKTYDVERSVDGINFSNATTIKANGGNKSYSWLDGQSATGDNFYRIKSIDNTGQIQYSRIAKVFISKGNPSITVYPNPVKNGVMNIVFTGIVGGSYSAKLYNSTGLLVFEKEMEHIAGNGSKIIRLSKKLASGLYHLEITGGDNEDRKIIKLIVE